jgi:hypothetical protein
LPRAGGIGGIEEPEEAEECEETCGDLLFGEEGEEEDPEAARIAAAQEVEDHRQFGLLLGRLVHDFFAARAPAVPGLGPVEAASVTVESISTDDTTTTTGLKDEAVTTEPAAAGGAIITTVQSEPTAIRLLPLLPLIAQYAGVATTLASLGGAVCRPWRGLLLEGGAAVERTLWMEMVLTEYLDAVAAIGPTAFETSDWSGLGRRFAIASPRALS